MTPERLRVILAAYGARPERWPQAERSAALALIAADPTCARALEAEAKVDALLDSGPAPTPHGALVGQILASAPRRRPAHRWWAGLGLASAGLAGMLVGAVLLPMAMPRLVERSPASWVDDQPTLFSDEAAS